MLSAHERDLPAVCPERMAGRHLMTVQCSQRRQGRLQRCCRSPVAATSYAGSASAAWRAGCTALRHPLARQLAWHREHCPHSVVLTCSRVEQLQSAARALQTSRGVLRMQRSQTRDARRGVLGGGTSGRAWRLRVLGVDARGMEDDERRCGALV